MAQNEVYLPEINLSFIKRDQRQFNEVFEVKNHMMKFRSLRYVTNVFSCFRKGEFFFSFGVLYRDSNITETNILKLFFPICILLALVPKDSNRILTIENITLAVIDVYQDLIPPGVRKVGLGQLKIRYLTIAICGGGYFSRFKLEDTLREYNISYSYVYFLREDSFASLAKGLPQADDPLFSSHTMFGDKLSCIKNICSRPSNFEDNNCLIAILGHGYNPWPFFNEKRPQEEGLKVADTKNFYNETFPVCNDDLGYTLPWLIRDYTKSSSCFVICQTTSCANIIANGATAKAIKWLREQRRDYWQAYDNLIILIPYGGQYMEDEMIEITKATDEGIIIVCAAGDCKEGGDVVFPAALGTVISVGVAGTGPKGREVDVSVNFSNHPLRRGDINLPGDCGVAAAKIAGLLAQLLSYIHTILNRPRDLDESSRRIVSAIKSTPHHLHTCVIRELLVNEGNGSHHPQLGYGDGGEIIMSLCNAGPTDLIEKLANVILKRHFEPRVEAEPRYPQVVVSLDDREKRYHGLTGDRIIVAVFDCKNDHGEKCVSVLRTLCPAATVWQDFNTKQFSQPFYNQLLSQTDVVSCSIAVHSFDYDLCTAVNKAVMEGKIIVFAAGNYGQSHSNTVMYPGRIGNILVIGGRDAYYNRVGLSSVGREMDFLAEALQFKGGTSFAAPVVAGYIALLLEFIKGEMKDYTVFAWSENPCTRVYEWRDIEAFDAAHNVFAMRALLKLLVPKPRVHSEMEGFGSLDFSELFPSYRLRNNQFAKVRAKEKIYNRLQKFYCRYHKT